MRGGERMEIQGLGNNYFPLSGEKTVHRKELGFQQVLNNVVNKNNTKQTSYSNEDKNDIKDAKGVLSFLKKSDLKEMTDGQHGIDDHLANSSSGQLQIVKKLFGISDQKWSEMIADLEANTKQKLKSDDPTDILIEGLTFFTMNPSLEGLTDNTLQFLKAAKVYSLLSNQDSSAKQLLAGLLESVQDQVQAAIQNDQKQSKLTYLQNTFSQLVSEMKEQTAAANQSDRLKAANRLTDWNASSPFLQQMSMPEQLTIMGEGSTKSVFVNDLIQQFESILSKSQFSKMGGVQKLFIKLNPEHLGSIRIELIQKDQVFTARILTTTEAAKEVLETHLHNLKHAFEAQNIKVDNVEIGQQSSQGQQDDFYNSGQSNRHQEYPQDQGSETDDQQDDSTSFILTLEEAILNQEV
jgi:flagellar hook-length control protein FliK